MPQENTTDTKKKKVSKDSTSKISKPRARWGTTIRISWDVYDFIMKSGKFGETFNDVLARLIKFS